MAETKLKASPYTDEELAAELAALRKIAERNVASVDADLEQWLEAAAKIMLRDLEGLKALAKL